MSVRWHVLAACLATICLAVILRPLAGLAGEGGAQALIAAVVAGDRARVGDLAGDLAKDRAAREGRDGAGRTALLVAVDRGDTEIAKVLIAAGADVNAVALNKDTPWLLAGARGHAEMLEAMLPAGPDLKLVNRFGGSALIPACERGHVEAIRVLLRTKIDVDLVNNLGWTCLLEIVVLGNGGPRHVEATRLVLAAGANPNIADNDGVSPLQHAHRRGQSEVARLIAAAGGR
jgi:ankyrin repeat protein